MKGKLARYEKYFVFLLAIFNASGKLNNWIIRMYRISRLFLGVSDIKVFAHTMFPTFPIKKLLFCRASVLMKNGFLVVLYL